MKKAAGGGSMGGRLKSSGGGKMGKKISGFGSKLGMGKKSSGLSGPVCNK